VIVVIKRIIRLGFIFTLFFLSPSTLSAELSDFHYEIIQIAFMNGYVNALEPDLDTIKSLKENSDKLKKYSKLAANNYMKKVSELNWISPKNSEESKGQSTGYQSQLWH
jgi:hypothetical protein